MMDATARYYSRPSYLRGSGFPVYSGSRRQRGGSILGAIKTFFTPIVRSIAKSGTKQALGLASDVARDAIFGNKSVGVAIKQHGLRRAKRMGANALNQVVSNVSNMLGKPQRKPSRKRPISGVRRPAKRRKNRNF